jgi:hypothetical protein
MSWGAVAVGGATIVAQYMSERERRAAEQRAADREDRRAGEQAQLTDEQFAARMEQQQQEAATGRSYGAQQSAYDRQLAREQMGLGADIQREQFYATRGEASQSRRDREDMINRQMQKRFGRLRGETVQGLSPYSQAGAQAQREQAALMGLGGQQAQSAAMARFRESPGQAFLRGQQEKALLRSQAAIGGLGGGNVRTALQEQAFGRAQTDYDRQLQRLGQLSGRGVQAQQTIAGMGTGPGYVQTGTDVGVISGPSQTTQEMMGAYRGGTEIPEFVEPEAVGYERQQPVAAPVTGPSLLPGTRPGGYQVPIADDRGDAIRDRRQPEGGVRTAPEREGGTRGGRDIEREMNYGGR